MAFNRKKIEEKIFTTFTKLDKSGLNTTRYKEIFSKMNDKEFLAYFKNMASDDSKNFYLEIDLFDKNKVELHNIEDAAKYLGVPLEEYIYFKHRSSNGEIYRTPFKVPVVYLHLKRMQQILSKKVIMNYNIMGPGARSRLTGSLNDSEKAGRLTDADTVSLMSISQNIERVEGEDSSDSAILREILGARADNTNLKMQMHNEISVFGTSKISRYEKEQIKSSQAVNTLDVFLMGAGLKSDVVTPTLTTVQGLKNKSN